MCNTKTSELVVRWLCGRGCLNPREPVHSQLGHTQIGKWVMGQTATSPIYLSYSCLFKFPLSVSNHIQADFAARTLLLLLLRIVDILNNPSCTECWSIQELLYILGYHWAVVSLLPWGVKNVNINKLSRRHNFSNNWAEGCWMLDLALFPGCKCGAFSPAVQC